MERFRRTLSKLIHHDGSDRLRAPSVINGTRWFPFARLAYRVICPTFDDCELPKTMAQYEPSKLSPSEKLRIRRGLTSCFQGALNLLVHLKTSWANASSLPTYPTTTQLWPIRYLYHRWLTSTSIPSASRSHVLIHRLVTQHLRGL
jgi:hypothetical protein